MMNCSGDHLNILNYYFVYWWIDWLIDEWPLAETFVQTSSLKSIRFFLTPLHNILKTQRPSFFIYSNNNNTKKLLSWSLRDNFFSFSVSLSCLPYCHKNPDMMKKKTTTTTTLYNVNITSALKKKLKEEKKTTKTSQ